MNKVVILDNIRSAYNVGAILRTADGAGVEMVYLVGYTPAPIDRFGRQQSTIAKTSLGANETVPTKALTTNDVMNLIQTLKAQGYLVVAVEQTTSSVSLSDFTVPDRVAYIFGNEIDGVAPELLVQADCVLELPMLGSKESLNVSVTAGIVLYRGL